MTAVILAAFAGVVLGGFVMFGVCAFVLRSLFVVTQIRDGQVDVVGVVTGQNAVTYLRTGDPTVRAHRLIRAERRPR